ncbi:hypothetical protein LAJ61_00545 [Moraxella osloensis]|nr:hypothetical protein [Moraxella osloensis]UAY37236.1 hypothetical protein LAJ61_00545 [Moraxella osloensis]
MPIIKDRHFLLQISLIMPPSFLAVKIMAVKVIFNRAVGLKPNQNRKEKAMKPILLIIAFLILLFISLKAW